MAPYDHRPDAEEEKKKPSGDYRKMPPSTAPVSASPASAYGFRKKKGNNDDDDIAVKQRARVSARSAASSGVRRKPPPPGATAITAINVSNTSTSTSTRTRTNTNTTAAALDAIAKSKGRRIDSHKYTHRQVPSSYQRKNNSLQPPPPSSSSNAVEDIVFSSRNSNSNSNSERVTRLEEEVTAKARGSRNKKIPMIKRAPLSSPSSNIKQLNRMEADVAAKEKSKTGRRTTSNARAKINITGTVAADDVTLKAQARAARTAAINGVALKAPPPPSSFTATTSAAGGRASLKRMEIDIAAKEKARSSRVSSIAMSAIRDQKKKSGSSTSNAANDIIAKKLSKTAGNRDARSVAQGTISAVYPGAVSSSNEDRIAYKTGTNRLAGSTGSNDKSKNSSKIKKDLKMNSSYMTEDAVDKYIGGTNNSNGENKFPYKDNDKFGDEESGNNGLAVAVAVNEDEDEDVFIPSAVEYDPDAMKAKVSTYKNHRIRVYGLLGCTLLIIIAACAVGVLAILEGDKELYSPPTMAPTCTGRCPSDFVQQLELEVGAQKLNNPSTPEYQAMEWIIYDDPMQLESTASNLVQRFMLATFYFDTHRLSNWRTCNKPGVADELEEDSISDNEEEEDDDEEGNTVISSANSTEMCDLAKLYSLEPMTFTTFPAVRWLSSFPECDWAGMTCDPTNQVRAINLHAQNIQGVFPDALTKLPYMQTIEMYWNEMTGTLPDSIGTMKHLINIEIQHNKFTGNFPTTWGNARNLQLMNIAGNSLTGQLPEAVGNFQNIKGLFIYENFFSGTLPPEFSKSRTLSFARLQKNSLTGTIPTEFGDMQLNELWLQRNEELSGTIPTELGLLTNYMRDLRLSQTSMEGTIPDEIYSLSSVWRLHLNEAGFSGTISPNIAQLEKLEDLKLGDNKFTGTLPEDWSSMTNLKNIELEGNQFSGSVPASLCKLKEEYNLVGIKADCLGVEPLIQCDCCDVCCDEQTGECIDTINE